MIRSQLANMFLTNRQDACTESGYIHQLFYSSRHSLTFEETSRSNLIAAYGSSKLIRKGKASPPTAGSIIVTPSHATYFSSNIVSVGLLSQVFLVLFKNALRE